ncbi:MAG: S41 family peptidase [Spirochaetaceae bacterium]|nr:MAG: S41 family peptidase [Spirochaetaceae bacterium]
MKGILKRERLVWMAITAVLLGFILLVSFAPTIMAQGPTYEDQKALRQFQDIYTYVKDCYADQDKTATRNLMDDALDGLFKSLGDPYSVYLTSESLREVEDTSAGAFGGVGLVISKQRIYDKDGKLLENTPIEVVSPLEGTPGFKAGFNAGDLIIKVDGESTLELTLDAVTKKMRGTPGTKVVLTVRRGESLVFDVSVVRASIEVPTVKSAMMENGIGYIRIIEFTNFTPGRIKEVITDFKAKGLKGLVIDLRSNPGGVLSSVVSIADYFLSEGQIVSVRSRVASENMVYNANKNNDMVASNFPLVVLIDRGSASASEIFAGAVKDQKRAVIIGEQSYGKGTVQYVKFIEDAGFKLTVAKFYAPNGYTIDKTGITPDIIIKEDDFTDTEKQSYERIIKDGLITQFVTKTPQPTEKQIADFLAGLKRDGITLRDLVLRRLINIEVSRKLNNPPVYDLGTDPVLQRAMEYLRTGK